MRLQRGGGAITILGRVKEEPRAIDRGEIEIDQECLDEIVIVGLLELQSRPRPTQRCP